jgi:hypothetical protein
MTTVAHITAILFIVFLGLALWTMVRAGLKR